MVAVSSDSDNIYGKESQENKSNSLSKINRKSERRRRRWLKKNRKSRRERERERLRGSRAKLKNGNMMEETETRNKVEKE